jgi:hypothetical protein
MVGYSEKGPPPLVGHSDAHTWAAALSTRRPALGLFDPAQSQSPLLAYGHQHPCLIIRCKSSTELSVRLGSAGGACQHGGELPDALDEPIHVTMPLLLSVGLCHIPLVSSCAGASLLYSTHHRRTLCCMAQGLRTVTSPGYLAAYLLLSPPCSVWCEVWMCCHYEGVQGVHVVSPRPVVSVWVCAYVRVMGRMCA